MKGFKIFSVIAALLALVGCWNEEDNCAHKWSDGVCVECGKVCSHAWNGCICTICGKDKHDWVDGSCAECGELTLTTYAWCIKSFCGSPVEADLYIKFTKTNTFTILQRTDMNGYRKYLGTYVFNKGTSILSGMYSDGEAWGCDYKYSIDEELNLTLESVSNPAEFSVYVPTEMPDVSLVQSLSRAGDVKPL